MAEPFGPNDDQHAPDETKHRPEGGQMLDSSVSVLFIHKQLVDHYERRQQDEAYSHYCLKPLPQKFDDENQFHEIRC
jgi:hypothetical protein